VIRFPEKNVKSKSKINDINIDNKDDEEDEHPRSNPLHTFSNAVREEFGVKNESDTQTTDTEHLSYLEIIEQTRVPLVKFTIEPYNIDIDVCFDQPGGPESADLMHRFMSSMPPLRPLTFVLKYFLASRDINKPFTGGIGSYMLQLMIVSFLQHRSREERYRVGRIENVFNLGSLLVDFFEFYGADLNYLTTGISVRNDGFYFAKGERDKKSMFWQPGRPFSLAIENPLDTTMDVGAGAYRIQMIQRVFQHSYQTLLAYVAEPREKTDSILTRIIPPTAEMEKRRLHKLSLGDEGTVAPTPEDKKNRKHLEDRWKNPKNRNSEKRSSSGRTGVEKSSSKKHRRDRRDSAGSKNNRDKRHGR
jgi:non-canonical poly(A) RNA polymerase PAPD5/7